MRAASGHHGGDQREVPINRKQCGGTHDAGPESFFPITDSVHENNNYPILLR